ncbi:diguanylate cyclase/phosphodiesterase (GGDEF & EAL domains) with PAS/PAC sensor(s) [Olavius algarvensis associated proteobacterium Delta 3]|nr:diguanylate cyclase/phosphodiesterase (GGDEF & EAL domains) with PAS/PAC sensor(s) [Olavius algarvensis associated proteobacterium Delta 3]CAB5149784.1 diguanylate cyclase/phosphodiesterase (GGDEF & EAL domains) with PAS/PAC sensor(s) [Olavius algarvensis associated proteobacterium Delta 3]
MSKYELGKHLARHVGLGAVIGYAVLHPASVVVHSISEGKNAAIPLSLVSAFLWEHAQMAIYFTIIGAAFGLLNGFNTYRQAMLHSKIKLLSITDDLTGLYNRRFAMQSIVREIQRADRYGTPLSLMMIDIDCFKQYNDTYGHPAGDQLLQQFSDRLRSLARKTDLVARYGGEEFLALMPNTDITMAVHLAERIRNNIETFPFELGESQPEGKITVSIGCSRFDSFHRLDVQDIIREADACLYRAKNDGRNRICY